MTDAETEAALESGASVFLDTSLLVAATVEVHPSHDAAADTVHRLISQDARLFISPQICREFLVVLTRQPIHGRRIDLDEALAALHPWTVACTLLDELEAVHRACVDLVRRFGVHGKQIHDCNIVATMATYDVRLLATRNPSDFRRFHPVVSLIAVDG
jgi:predicted nucleic acid-binding protein